MSDNPAVSELENNDAAMLQSCMLLHRTKQTLCDPESGKAGLHLQAKSPCALEMLLSEPTIVCMLCPDSKLTMLVHLSLQSQP